MSGWEYLKPSAGLEAVQKVYRRALIKIHPDKASRSDFAAHYRATELFKIVSEAFQAFQKTQPAAAPSPSAGAMGSPTAAAAASMAAASMKRSSGVYGSSAATPSSASASAASKPFRRG